jgi:hypothetical protein
MGRHPRKPAYHAGLLLLILALTLAACQSPFGRDRRPPASAPGASALECDGPANVTLVQAVVDRFDSDYDQVMVWLCAGETIDDIMLALQTSRLTGRPVDEILAASKDIGWQALWKGYDVPPAAVAGAEDVLDLQAEAYQSQTEEVVQAEEDADAGPPADAEVPVRLVTRSGQDAGRAAILWDGNTFVLVGLIATVEAENWALQVRVPTEGRRDATYLVRLPAYVDPHELPAGSWVRIRGERGEGAYLLALEIERLYPVPAVSAEAPATTAGGSPTPTSQASDWEEPEGDIPGASGSASSSESGGPVDGGDRGDRDDDENDDRDDDRDDDENDDRDDDRDDDENDDRDDDRDDDENDDRDDDRDDDENDDRDDDENDDKNGDRDDDENDDRDNQDDDAAKTDDDEDEEEAGKDNDRGKGNSKDKNKDKDKDKDKDKGKGP